jgi:hypothetical protein
VNPEPPRITITNPNAPAGTPDLLDHGRDPWRPSRRQVAVTAVVLLLLSLVGAGVAELRHVRHEHALDRQALREVRLTLGVDEPDAGLSPDIPPWSVQLNVLNHGPAMVHVRTVQLDDGPQLPVTTGSDVLPGAVTQVIVTLSGSCNPDTGRATHDVTVRLTTGRGQAVTRVQHLGSDELLNTRERARCGTLTPDEALAWSVPSSRTRGAWVEVVYDLRNTSVLPVTVTSISFPAGLDARLPALPLALAPADAPGTTGPSRRVHVQLRVHDCQAFNTGLSDVEGFTAVLGLHLHGPLEDATWQLPLQPSEEDTFGVVSPPDPQLALMGFCPDLFFD